MHVFIYCVTASLQLKTKNCHLSFFEKMFTGVDTYKCFTSCLLLFKTYFWIVFNLYHVTYYYLHCLLFNVVCFELNWIELNWIELNWIELNWIELNWIELNWIELNWIELNWIELNWIELNWKPRSQSFHYHRQSDSSAKLSNFETFMCELIATCNE